MNLTVVGAGYVGLANAVLLSQKHNIIIYDIDQTKVDLINENKSPIHDEDIEKFLCQKKLNISASSDLDSVFLSSDFVIIATPTNFDVEKNYFDTSSIETILDYLSENNLSPIVVIKSTIPIGYTEKISSIYPMSIVFCPEFLREGSALHDSLYPSRIIVGEKSNIGKKVSNLFLEASLNDDVNILQMGPKEAESVKLFSNSYLAMRVAYFNEIDTFCLEKGLDTSEIIRGMSLDKRIGDFYNNPSFGYGGYCLPKDTRQILSNFDNIPQKIISAIVESNEIRKRYISDKVSRLGVKCVGIYRLTMKSNSDNFRESAIIDVINNLSENDLEIIIFEPLIKADNFNGIKVINDFEVFSEKSQVILANRLAKEHFIPSEKIVTSDLFGNN